MSGKTLLCVGNTLEEAFCQGLNEVEEWYVLWNIFNTFMTPHHFIPLCNSNEYKIYEELFILEYEYEISIHNCDPNLMASSLRYPITNVNSWGTFESISIQAEVTTYGMCIDKTKGEIRKLVLLTTYRINKTIAATSYKAYSNSRYCYI